MFDNPKNYQNCPVIPFPSQLYSGEHKESPRFAIGERVLISKRGLVFCALTLLLATWAMPAHAQSSSAQITMTISASTVNIVMHLVLTENFTRLPSLTIHIDPSHSSNISQPMNDAMRRLVPSATIDSLDLVAKTALINQATNMSLLEEDYTIQVSGVNKNLGSTIDSDMTFLFMNVTQPITVQGFELNNLGAVYLYQPLLNLRNLSLQQHEATTRYFLDTKTFLNTVIPGDGTLHFSLLDFTWMHPLTGWSHQDEPLGSSSTWLLSSDAVLPYNLTVGFRLLENQYFPVYEAVYDPSIQISAPARAISTGNIISFNLTTPAEIVMPAIIVATLAIGIGTFVLDRSFTGSFRRRKRKR